MKWGFLGKKMHMCLEIRCQISLGFHIAIKNCHNNRWQI